MAEYRIEVEVLGLGDAATDEDVAEYCDWADAWFAREYPELDVEHRPGAGITPSDVQDAENECFAAWCARRSTASAYTVSFRDESGESHDVHGDSLEDLSRGLGAAGYTGSHLRVVTDAGDTVGFVSADDWQPARN